MSKSIGLNALEIESYNSFNTLLQTGLFEWLTMLDSFNLRGLNRQELTDLLYNVYQTKNARVHRVDHTQLKNGEAQQLLLRINKVYAETISFMEKSLLLKIPKMYRDKKWQSVDSFVHFMQSLSAVDRKGYAPIIECAILKTMNAVHDVLDNPHLSGLEHKIEHAIGKIRKNKRLIEKGRTETEELFIYDAPIKNGSDEDHHNPEISIVNRVKQLDSIVRKNIGDRKYSSVKLLHDVIGIRIEVRDFSEEQIISLMNDVAESVFSGECTFDQKRNFLSNEWISQLMEKVKGMKVRDIPKNARSSDKYQDAKIIGEIKWHGKHPYPVEIQFVHVDNKNESGFSNHHILDMKKVLTNVTRLFGTLTVGNIKVAINEIGRKSGLKPKAILNHLFFPGETVESDKITDKLGFLIPVRMTNGSVRFITKDAYHKIFDNLYLGYPRIITEHIDGIHEEGQPVFDYNTFLELYEQIKM